MKKLAAGLAAQKYICGTRRQFFQIIPQTASNLEFGPRESSRGSTIANGSILTT
jgi:hypothetical protein